MTERPYGITPSQTIGPYYAYCLTPNGRYPFTASIGADLVTQDAAGERIGLTLRVTDGDGAPVTDSLLEIWQADGEGRYAHPADPRRPSNAAFKGFGRAEPDGNGEVRFETVKPGQVAGPNGAMQAPHIAVSVFARGMLNRLVTRVYFADEAANFADPILALVPTDRRGTLVAMKTGDKAYRLDIRLQGPGETVFFKV
jgi:protocatechuate 3,4-dioxygenase alpha subunit